MALQRRDLLALSAVAGIGLVWSQATPREIDIVAQRFKFTPNVIVLRTGEPVLLLLRSLDFSHGFYLPDLNLRTDLIPGRVVRLAFTPTAAGRLPFLCDNFCGDGHEGMDGHFEVA